MPRVVGLDLGRMSAWAKADTPYLRGWTPRSALEGLRASLAGLTHGEWDLGKHSDWERVYAKMWANLDALHEEMPIDVLAFESAGTFFKSENAVWSIIGLCVVCRTWCGVNHVEPHMVHNMTVKKHATGHGHSEKDAIMDAATRLFGDPVTHNRADALFVLDLCLTEQHRPRR